MTIRRKIAVAALLAAGAASAGGCASIAPGAHRPPPTGYGAHVPGAPASVAYPKDVFLGSYVCTTEGCVTWSGNGYPGAAVEKLLSATASAGKVALVDYER